jgi:glycosyltransferase involved in cell wall biosynthesis
MRTAVVYDYLPAAEGGGERALIELITHFKDDVHIYFGFVVDSDYSRKTLKLLRETYGSEKIHTGPTVRFLRPIFFRIMYFLLPSLLQSFDFSSFELVFSFTAFLAHSIVPPLKGRHILYMNTPARFLWNLPHAYSRLKVIATPFLITDVMRFRSRLYDLSAIAQIKTIFGNSTAVVQRINTFYNKAATVLFPPAIPDSLLNSDLCDESLVQEFGPYFVYMGRIESYKNLDLLLDLLARERLPENIIIIGTGPYLRVIKSRLRKIFGNAVGYDSTSLDVRMEKFGNVYVSGYIEEAKKMTAAANASAFFSLNNEDFGITTVEALALGTPVIALYAGGAADVVKDGISGVFFAEGTPEALMEAIQRHRQLSYSKNAIRKSAKPYTISAFHVNLDKLLYA